jgi:hypothetical protein
LADQGANLQASRAEPGTVSDLGVARAAEISLVKLGVNPLVLAAGSALAAWTGLRAAALADWRAAYPAPFDRLQLPAECACDWRRGPAGLAQHHTDPRAAADVGADRVAARALGYLAPVVASAADRTGFDDRVRGLLGAPAGCACVSPAWRACLAQARAVIETPGDPVGLAASSAGFPTAPVSAYALGAGHAAVLPDLRTTGVPAAHAGPQEAGRVTAATAALSVHAAVERSSPATAHTAGGVDVAGKPFGEYMQQPQPGLRAA